MYCNSSPWHASVWHTAECSPNKSSHSCKWISLKLHIIKILYINTIIILYITPQKKNGQTVAILLTSVDAIMTLEIIITNESLITLIALVWFLSSVPKSMPWQFSWCLEGFITAFNFTLMGLLFLMHSAMNPAETKDEDKRSYWVHSGNAI